MSTPFQAALEAGDLAAIRACPKADLHIHAIMGGCREFIRERTGRDIAPLEGVLGSMDEMHAWTDTQTGGLFRDAAGRAVAFEATFVQARRDGVTRLEVGSDVWEITLHDNSAQAVWEMLSAAHAQGGPGDRLDPADVVLAALPGPGVGLLDVAVARTGRLRNP